MIAKIIDILLIVLASGALALITWKAIQLYQLSGRVKGLAPQGEVAINRTFESGEAGLAMLATIAAAAPFIGLAGTVLHIIEALGRLGAGADISVVSGPIATALNSTLLGLASAVPAAIAYNLMQRRLQVLENRVRAEKGELPK